jgi:pimeloyl-ACP methyl ester carboxylesterase
VDGIAYGFIAREAAKAVLNRARRRGPHTLVIYAGDFRGYGNSAASRRHEILDYQNLEWYPMTPDFAATAGMTAWPNQTIYRAATAAEFFRILANAHGTIGRVVFIGHGGGTVLAFSGRRRHNPTPPNPHYYVSFGSILDAAALTANAANLTRIRTKLADEATFDVVACGSIWTTAAFLRTLANSFGMIVRGFNGPLKWYFDYDARRNIITKRGYISDESMSRALLTTVVVQGAHRLSFTVMVKPSAPAPTP